MNEIITQINDVLWTYLLIGALIACGLWFTWKTKGVQFRMIGEMFRLLTDSATNSLNPHSDSCSSNVIRNHSSADLPTISRTDCIADGWRVCSPYC